MSNGEFSEEQSEELISHLKSGGPAEFEQLRSTLNLLAHVTELPPTAIPPVLPSGITQPIPLLPARSAKPRRTVVTSVIVVGILASASLAAAAVTGIGPTPIVNMGHETAKFVKGVAGAVSHVVTGNTVESVVNRPPQVPGLTPAPTSGDDGSANSIEESDNESGKLPILPIPNAPTPQVKPSHETKDSNSQDANSKSDGEKVSNSNEGTVNSGEDHSGSQESQSPKPENSPSATPSSSIKLPTSKPTGEQEHSDSEGRKTPDSTRATKIPSVLPTQNSSDDSSDDD